MFLSPPDMNSISPSFSCLHLLLGKDLIGIGETGSGKTLAFILPAIVHISEQPPLKEGDGPVAVILVPSRELATQVSRTQNSIP